MATAVAAVTTAKGTATVTATATATVTVTGATATATCASVHGTATMTVTATVPATVIGTETGMASGNAAGSGRLVERLGAARPLRAVASKRGNVSESLRRQPGFLRRPRAVVAHLVAPIQMTHPSISTRVRSRSEARTMGGVAAVDGGTRTWTCRRQTLSTATMGITNTGEAAAAVEQRRGDDRPRWPSGRQPSGAVAARRRGGPRGQRLFPRRLRGALSVVSLAAANAAPTVRRTRRTSLCMSMTRMATATRTTAGF